MKKMTLLESKIEKSPTCFQFENFDPDPQLDIKFETHRNVGEHFYFAYKYIHSSKYSQSSKKIKGNF